MHADRARRFTALVVVFCVLALPASAPAQVGVPQYSRGGAVLLSISAPLGAPTSDGTIATPTDGTIGQFVSIGVGAVIVGGTLWFAQSIGPVPCAPCDPAGVNVFDRGTIHPVRGGWGVATDVTVLGVVGGTWIDMARRDQGTAGLRASLESVVWSTAVTQVLKVTVRRIRPYMYADGSELHVQNPDSRQSFPSGHTAAAFAMATSYFLVMDGVYDQRPYWIFGAAAFVGVGRVLAGKHWITDVLAGAVIGTATALVVNEVRFN
jgi:membrane-associated phospholipid phosphatase